MASTSQVRAWWDEYCCEEAKLVRYPFPGEGKVWNCLVAPPSVPVWEAFAQLMTQASYWFKESAGGTYNCRPISGSENMSLHSYGVALDLNPSKNPQKSPLTHNYPEGFVEAAELIHCGNGASALSWGGRWSTPDAMHWQIDCSPADIATGVIGVPDMTGPNGEPNWDEVSDWAQKAWSQAHKADLLTEDSHPRDDLEVEQLMVYLERAGVI